MTPQEFEQLARDYNRIPLVREVLADLETPLSAYMKLANSPYTYLFESVQGGEKWGRYSIIGLAATTILRVCGNELTIEENGNVIERKQVADPLSEIEAFKQLYRVPELANIPRFAGGLVGYFGYDTIQYIEPHLRGEDKDDPLQCPDILLMVSDRIVVFDNLAGKLYLIVHANIDDDDAYSKAHEDLDAITAKLYHNHIDQPVQSRRTVNEKDFVSGFTREKFEKAVSRIKEYIVEGDVMQVVLSQRLSIPFQAPAINLYRALRCLNPSPYMFYMHLDDFQVVGSSPEILVRLEDEIVTVRPIAGTRPRGKGSERTGRAPDVDRPRTQ